MNDVSAERGPATALASSHRRYLWVAMALVLLLALWGILSRLVLRHGLAREAREAAVPTVITTNARLLTQMDDRLRSRLADIDLARHVAIKAQDYREHRTRRQAPGRGERPAAGERTGRRGFGG